jgi:hypothetical protein
MSARMYYGDYQFLPAPLLNRGINYTYDAADNLIYKEVAYNLTGTLVNSSGNFNTMMAARKALEAALAIENQQFVIDWNTVPLLSGYPQVTSVSFEEGVWVDRINYNVELIEKETATAISGIESYDENWSYTEDDNLRTITVEHSVNAKGFNTSGSGIDNSLINAKNYVLSLVGYAGIPAFMPAFTQGSGTLTAYESYRTENANESESTYEVSQTFILCSGNYIHTLEANFDSDVDGNVTVSLDGQIEGLGRGGNARWQNAIAGWADIKPRLIKMASGVYVRNGGAYDLAISPNSYSVAESQDLGTINYSYAYADSVNPLPSGISEFELTKDINEPVGVYVAHTIVNKTDGPVVQDLGTATEGTVTIAGRAVKKADYPLASLKSYINSQIAAEAPVGYGTSYRVTSKTYNIDNTGNIVEFSIEWTFTAPVYSSYLTYL